jgi:hypothetical protein
MQRRERTRHLIELGGLVQKAGLVELTADDRATLLGGMMALADMLSGQGGEALREIWRRRGMRVFAMEAVEPRSSLADAAEVDDHLKGDRP